MERRGNRPADKSCVKKKKKKKKTPELLVSNRQLQSRDGWRTTRGSASINAKGGSFHYRTKIYKKTRG